MVHPSSCSEGIEFNDILRSVAPALEKMSTREPDETWVHVRFTMILEYRSRILSGAILNSTPHEVAL